MSEAPLVPPKKRRICLKILGGLAALFIIVLVCIPFITSLCIPMVNSSIEQITGRQSSIRDMSLNLLSSKMFLYDLHIKEKEGTEDFLRLDKVEIDFSILPALFGKWELPKLEVSGLFLRVVRDQEGHFNFQSIQEHIVQEEKEPKVKQPLVEKKAEKKAIVLPKVLAKILLNNINLWIEDKVEKSHLEIKNFCFSLDVNGFDKITYASSWDKAEFQSQKAKNLVAGLLYKLGGEASVEMKEGKVVFHSKGDLVFSDIYARGFAQKDLAPNPIRLSHDFSLNMLSGAMDGKASFTSDYFSVAMSDLKISDLQKIQEQLSETSDTIDKEKIQHLLATLPIQGWKGKIEGWLSLDKFKQDFGEFIASTSQKAIGDFGGKLVFSTELEGKENSVLELRQKGDISNLYVSGQMPSQKTYKVSLLQIAKEIFVQLDLKNRTFMNRFDYTIKADESSVLASVQQESKVEKLWESSPLEIKLFQYSFLFDLDVLNKVLADLMPQNTQIRGKIEQSDSLTFEITEGAKLTGKTNISAQVLAPGKEKLPGIMIQGERDIEAVLDSKYSLKKLNIKKFGQKTQRSELLQFSSKGEIDLESDQEQALELSFKIVLKELQPYLDVLAQGMKIKGNITHAMKISKKEDTLQIQSQGQLVDFGMIVEQNQDRTTIAVKEAKWGNDISGRIKEKQISDLAIQKLFFHHPAFMADISGNLKKDAYDDSFKHTIQCKVDVPKIDLPGLKALVTTRKGKTPLEKIEKIEKVREKIQPDPNKPLAILTKAQREQLKQWGLNLEIAIHQIILDSANQVKDLNTKITFNHEASDNHFYLTTIGKTNTGTIDIKGNGNLNQDHPEFEFTYDLDKIPYIVELFEPAGEKIQSIMPFPLIEKMKMDPAEIRFTVKGDTKWQGLDPRCIKKSLLGGKNTFQLSKGKFDLGFDFAKYLDTKNLEKEMESHIAPMKNTLDLLKGQENTQNASIKSAQEKIQQIQAKIDDLESKRKDALGLIEKLKPLAQWNPMTKSKLQEAEQKLDGYGKQINDYKNQQGPLSQSMNQVKAKIADIQKQMQETQAKMQSAKEEFLKKMRFDNPFAFEFDAFTLAFTMENNKPWDKQGTLQELSPYSFSKINYVEVTFSPSERNVLKITGWISLDGKYHLSFMPPKENIDKLSQSVPWLAQSIQEQGGVIMSSEGMKPNPMGK